MKFFLQDTSYYFPVYYYRGLIPRDSIYFRFTYVTTTLANHTSEDDETI